MKENAFKNRKVYIMLFSALNLLRIIFNTDFSSLTLIGAFSKLLSLAVPLSILVYLIADKKDLSFKKTILPTGFGLSCVTVFIAGWQSSALSVYDEAFGIYSMIIIGLQALAVILIFVGTLFDFENIGYLKLGSLGMIAAIVISTVVDVVIAKMNGAYGFNWLALAGLVITVLFYFGIYLLAKEKSK